MRLRKECEHGRWEEHEDEDDWQGESCPGGEFLPEGALVPAWIGDSSVDEVSDLVWDEHAEVIDVSGMDPVWVLTRVLDALAASKQNQVGESE